MVLHMAIYHFALFQAVPSMFLPEICNLWHLERFRLSRHRNTSFRFITSTLRPPLFSRHLVVSVFQRDFLGSDGRVEADQMSSLSLRRLGPMQLNLFVGTPHLNISLPHLGSQGLIFNNHILNSSHAHNVWCIIISLGTTPRTMWRMVTCSRNKFCRILF